MNFYENTSVISGRNASGKTTLMDAFFWLLFGKDSQGRSDFQIRPVDENGQMVDNVDIEVSAVLDVDGERVELYKKQSQKWTKHRGSSAPTFEGNVNSFQVDGFPVSQKEYTEKVSSIVSEELFKLITSPMAFPSMKWQDQRRILMRMVEDVSDEVKKNGVHYYKNDKDDINITSCSNLSASSSSKELKKLKENVTTGAKKSTENGVVIYEKNGTYSIFVKNTQYNDTLLIQSSNKDLLLQCSQSVQFHDPAQKVEIKNDDGTPSTDVIDVVQKTESVVSSSSSDSGTSSSEVSTSASDWGYDWSSGGSSSGGGSSRAGGSASSSSRFDFS